MNSLSEALRLIPDRYAALHAAAALTQTEADTMVATALPLARQALGDRAAQYGPAPLPVKATVVDNPQNALYGRFMGAWPVSGADGVEIFTLSNWDFFLSLLEASVEPAGPPGAFAPLMTNRSRIWVGIMNDVLQCFVNDPPKGTYSMIRHHALMLLTATLWLPDDWQTPWWGLYEATAAWARTHWRVTGSLDTYLRRVESRAFDIFRDLASLSAANTDWAWIGDYRSELEQVLTYLQATCVAVSPLSQECFALPSAERAAWLTRMVNEDHAREDFNLDGMRRILELR